MTLNLIQILPDSRSLAHFAHRTGLPDDDPGYLWHRALRDAFGPIAPQPFRCLDAAARPVRLLGYGAADAHRLRQALALAAPDLDRVFPPDRIESKALPLPFAPGARLAFETRICPIVRTTSSDGARQRELDAFVHHALGVADEPRSEREPVYCAWLAERLAAGGGRLLGARMKSFRLGPLVRRRHASPKASGTVADEPARRLLAAGRRAAARRPEVVFDGILEVTDPDAFAGLIARGVGRHRAFGFGMLLLRPA
jgi:CRISPR system Cascade subunit CasE